MQSSSSDHARLAYSEAGSELFEAFDLSDFASVKAPVTFATEDGAAELYLVDSTYALIAQGVGRFEVDLVPGHYQVRQRVGDTESVHEFEVAGEHAARFILPRLDFPTPIPLPDSVLALGAGLEHRVLEPQSGNLHVLLWTPVSRPVAADTLNEAWKTLSIESFDGQWRIPVTPQISEHSVWLARDLEPGSYVLVQQIARGRQRCLPLRIVPGLVTSVYLVLLCDDNEREIPLELQHAAITMLPPSMERIEVIGSLRRLEAARKALALGRQVAGWSAWESDSVKNPLLALIDDHRAGVSALLDSQPVDADLMALDITTGQPLPDVLKAPPLLRRSWSRLLQIPSGNAALLALFPFDYEVESSNAWFIWNEVPGARTPHALGTPAIAAKVKPGIWSTLAGLALAFSTLRKSNKQPVQAGQSVGSPSYEELVTLLTGLVENTITRKLLRATYRALEDSAKDEKDPVVQQMFSALETMTDKTLLKAMGAEELVRSALGSLELPQERRTEYARALFKLLQPSSDEKNVDSKLQDPLDRSN
jgi:hypothetical protein